MGRRHAVGVHDWGAMGHGGAMDGGHGQRHGHWGGDGSLGVEGREVGVCFPLLTAEAAAQQQQAAQQQGNQEEEQQKEQEQLVAALGAVACRARNGLIIAEARVEHDTSTGKGAEAVDTAGGVISQGAVRAVAGHHQDSGYTTILAKATTTNGAVLLEASAVVGSDQLLYAICLTGAISNTFRLGTAGTFRGNAHKVVEFICLFNKEGAVAGVAHNAIRTAGGGIRSATTNARKG